MAPIARIARSLALTLAAALMAGTALAAPDLPAARPARDPFLTLIEKPVRRPPIRKPERIEPVARRPAPIPPIRLEVLATIRGERAGTELALVEYRGEEYLVGTGWDGAGVDGFDGRFRVVELDSHELVLYDARAKRRQRVALTERPGEGLELSAAR